MTRADQTAHSVDVSQLRPGARVAIRTASVVDLPGVVKMRLIHGSLDTASQGQIVAQSPRTLTVCPPGCTTPIAVPKPDTPLVAVVVGVESGIVHLDVETESHEVILPTVAIASLKAIGRDQGVSARGSGLVGEHVAVDVGAIVELPSHVKADPPSALRDAFIDGAQLTEVRAADGGTTLLVPAPMAHIEGNVVTVDGDVLRVWLRSGRLVTIPKTGIAALHIERFHSRARDGALIGIGVGLVVGVALAARCPSAELGGICPLVTLGGLTFGGTLAGAVAGQMASTWTWERVDPRRLNFAVMPDPRGGVRGRLAVRF